MRQLNTMCSRNKLHAAPFLASYCKRKRGSLARPGGDFGKLSARPGEGGISETVRLAPPDGGRICGGRPRAKINKPTHPQLPRLSVRRLRATRPDGCWGRKYTVGGEAVVVRLRIFYRRICSPSMWTGSGRRNKNKIITRAVRPSSNNNNNSNNDDDDNNDNNK